MSSSSSSPPPPRRSLPRRAPSFISTEASDKYDRLINLPFFHECFVDYGELLKFDILAILQAVGLHETWNACYKTPYYPDLVREFYSNMQTVKDEIDGEVIISRVQGHSIVLTAKKMKEIMKVPASNTGPFTFMMSSPTVLDTLGPYFKISGSAPLLPANPRLITKLVVHNLVPRTNVNYLCRPLAKCVYAIMGRLCVDWGRVLISSLSEDITTHLVLPCTITRILHHFDIPTTGFMAIQVLNDIDDATIRKMTLPPPPPPVEEDPEEDPMYTPGSSSQPRRKRKICVSREPTYSSGRATLGSQLNRLRGDFEDFKSDVSTGMTSLRSELSQGIADIRTDIASGFAGMQTHFSSLDSSVESFGRVCDQIQGTQGMILNRLENYSSRYPGPPGYPPPHY